MELPDLHLARSDKTHLSVQPLADKGSVAMHLGWVMRRYQEKIALIQWGMLGIYLFLLLAPLIFPTQQNAVFFWEDLQLFSVFVFWGVGWPLIMLSTLIFGRIWCGVFCPDGTLTEAISRYGQKRAIPRWIRWPGWPGLMLVFYSLFLFLSGATRHHQASLILLGSLTLFAILTGFLFGNGRRIWCMYLCPSNIIFAFLARLSLFYYRVDKTKWDAYQGPYERINCAPLVNIKQMQGTSSCHACGRCIGYRHAVELATRKPCHEILAVPSKQTSTIQATTLLFGMIGMGTSTLFFSRAPWENLQDISLLLMICLVSGCALLLGGVLSGLIWLAGRIAGEHAASWQQLSLGLVPLAGIGLISGFFTGSLDFVGPTGWVRQSTLTLQLFLLGCAFLFSFWLGKQLIFRKRTLCHAIALTIYTVTLCLLGSLSVIILWA